MTNGRCINAFKCCTAWPMFCLYVFFFFSSLLNVSYVHFILDNFRSLDTFHVIIHTTLRLVVISSSRIPLSRNRLQTDYFHVPSMESWLITARKQPCFTIYQRLFLVELHYILNQLIWREILAEAKEKPLHQEIVFTMAQKISVVAVGWQ